MNISDSELGNILVASGLILQENLDDILLQKQIEKLSLIDYLTTKANLTKEQIWQAVSDHFGFSFVDLENYNFDSKLLKSVDALTVQQYQFIPLEIRDSTLLIAFNEPTNLKALDDLSILLGKPIEPVIVVPEKLSEKINELYGATDETLEEMLAGIEEGEVLTEEEKEQKADLIAGAEDAPIIKLVNMILMQSLKDNASDIHIEPSEKELVLRYRIDGILRYGVSPPKKAQGHILSRIKLMSGMDIAEHRKPQDGRIKMRMMGKDIDFRVSALPCIYGESVVLRLLDKSSVQLGLEQVGFIGDHKEMFEEIIKKPNGILLVTGPTGSGKTTTLYSALNELNTPDKKIMTIEDPVEYMLDGINQVQVNHEIGLDFANGLRAMLRQSPDIIMVGEIRDLETASIAIRAALTGHLVFSTLHTNDAPSAVTRLVDMGVNPYLIASSIQAIMAQRLVRTICPECKEEYKPPEELLIEAEFPLDEAKNITFYHGAGCEKCNYTGYKGRTGIFELLVMDEELKGLVLKNVSSTQLRQVAREHGMRTLREDGFKKVAMGVTTIVEVMRNTLAEKLEM
ncbi:MAG TPA: type IV-A pilus assembly ATPase PilB [bacterium]|nr:type IV-A pilus assembly ATPase PilB [bacterium]HOL47476.1 type IV-A pilus assembly ATPase PilB [bacterium]HPQ18615.1 type IV-A pilus assembly ATPase PilB [bacterium]